jgi:homospermidine synthase
VKAIHIAERDTQVSPVRKRPGEFVNTWSIDGFVSEGCQPAELGWGTHERELPRRGARHESGCGAAIYLNRPGAGTRVRTWTPNAGPIMGFLVTHNESISIADYLTLKEGSSVLYRPTVHYAYHPCDDAVLSVHELAGRGWRQQEEQRLLMDEIASGMDELGVLLMGHARARSGTAPSSPSSRRGSWRRQQRHLAPGGGGALGGMVWAIENPAAGVSRPTTSTTRACSTWPGPTSARSSAPTRAGRRWPTAAASSPRTSTRPTRGSSRTS